MNQQMLQEIYAKFLCAYNKCAERLAESVSEIMVSKEPWRSEPGKEKEMRKLHEIWSDLDSLELFYTDEESYSKGIVSINRKLLLVEL